MADLQYSRELQSKFHPDHLKDLDKSGLSEETIVSAKIHTVPPGEISKRLGWNPQKVESAMSFPYGDTGFERLKNFPSYVDQEGHSVKYLQPRSSGVHLYIPPGIEDKLNDPSIPLFFTEGEKKCLRANQESFLCVGLGGIWNWREKNVDDTIQEIKSLRLLNRETNLVPDSDFIQNHHVLLAVYRLGVALEKLGAKVQIVCFPVGKEKCGFDDYLCKHSRDDFNKLPKITLKHPIFKKNDVTKKESAANGAKKQELEIGAASFKTQADILKFLDTVGQHQAFSPAQDYHNERLYYGVSFGKEKFIVSSTGELTPWDAFTKSVTLTDGGFSRSTFSVEGLKRFIEGVQVSSTDIYSRLHNLFKRFIFFKNPLHPTVLSLWVMGTYAYTIFRWYGYLWFRSPTKRSGKTFALELLGHTAFNATSVLVSPSEAYLFREVAANGPTVLLDELENCRKEDADKYGALIALLNAGFKKGAVVPRMEKQGQEYRSLNFHVYSPKALAGINRLNDTLEDRCFEILMLRKKKTEQTERFSLRKHGQELERLRDDLHIWGLTHASEVAKLYDQSDQLNIPEELDDRGRDIVEPLCAIAALIDTENTNIAVSNALRTFTLEQAGVRASSETEDEAIVKIVVALSELDLGPEKKSILTPDRLLELVKQQTGLEWCDNKAKAGRLMRKLGLESKSHRPVSTTVVRGYLITADLVKDLSDRYLVQDKVTSVPIEPVESVTSVTLEGKGVKSRSVTEGFVTDSFGDDFKPILDGKPKNVTNVTDNYGNGAGEADLGVLESLRHKQQHEEAQKVTDLFGGTLHCFGDSNTPK